MKIIIVESAFDKSVFDFLIKKIIKSSEISVEKPICSVDDIIPLGGCDHEKIKNKLNEIKTDFLRSTKSIHVGIVLDMDDKSIEQKLQTINTAIEKSQYSLHTPIEKTDTFYDLSSDEVPHKIKIACHLVSLNGQGELEHILQKIKNKNSHHADSLEEWKIAICKKQSINNASEKVCRKLWMDFYKRLDVLTQKQSKNAEKNTQMDKFLETHPDAFDFNRSLPELNNLKIFLDMIKNA